MSFRTVVITKQSSLSYKNRFLVVKQDVDEKYIHLSEIDTVIVDTPAVSISAYLLKELSDNKINIIFCDEKHNPFGEMQSYYLSHNSPKKIMLQSKWDNEIKNTVWEYIVKNKIANQILLLKKIKSKRYELLDEYYHDVKIGDKTNREGHAAKVYFNELFGKQFVRHHEDVINSSLNYGYAILLSTFNKEVISNGYITQLGLNHKSEFNEFNLSCDLMEPFRIVIDQFVYYNHPTELNHEYKMNLVNILNEIYFYDGKKYTLKDIIRKFVKNVFSTIEEGVIYKEFNIYER